jgi:hypothetical protein
MVAGASPRPSWIVLVGAVVLSSWSMLKDLVVTTLRRRREADGIVSIATDAIPRR